MGQDPLSRMEGRCANQQAPKPRKSKQGVENPSDAAKPAARQDADTVHAPSGACQGGHPGGLAGRGRKTGPGEGRVVAQSIQEPLPTRLNPRLLQEDTERGAGCWKMNHTDSDSARTARAPLHQARQYQREEAGVPGPAPGPAHARLLGQTPRKLTVSEL